MVVVGGDPEPLLEGDKEAMPPLHLQLQLGEGNKEAGGRGFVQGAGRDKGDLQPVDLVLEVEGDSLPLLLLEGDNRGMPPRLARVGDSNKENHPPRIAQSQAMPMVGGGVGEPKATEVGKETAASLMRENFVRMAMRLLS